MDHESQKLALGIVDLFLDVPARITAIQDRLESLNDRMVSQARTLQRLSQAEEEQDRLLRATVERQECLESASRQQALLTEVHYQQHVLDPLARQIFPLIDDLNDVLEEGHGDAPVRNLLDGLRAQLLDLLSTHGIEVSASRPGEPFDPASMRPMREVLVFQPDQDRTVSKVLKVGFRRGEAFLRPQFIEVCIYRSPGPVLSRPFNNKEKV